MKWFKIETRFPDGLIKLQSHYGVAGVGRYVLIMGSVASAMTPQEPDRCHWDVIADDLCRLLQITYQALPAFLDIGQSSGLWSWETLSSAGQLLVSNVSLNGQRKRIRRPSTCHLIRISIPKLLKMKDDYTRKSGHISKGVRTVDIDIDRDSTKETSFQDLAKVDNGLVGQVFEFWQAQPHLIHCRKLNGHQSAINSAVEYAGGGIHGVEIVNLCISRYSTLLANHHGIYRSVYKWNLSEFLSRRSHYNIDRLSGDDWEKPFIQWEKSDNKSTRNSDLYVGMNYDS